MHLPKSGIIRRCFFFRTALIYLGFFGEKRAPPTGREPESEQDMKALMMMGVAGALLALTGAATAAEGDAAAGQKTAFPQVYHVPKLGGQHPAYIAKALQAYRTGDRKHPSMRGIAASLTDQDIADLAAYYGTDTVKSAAK